MAVDYSIVIPVFNNQESIIKLVDSLSQKIISKHPDFIFEIIIVDDGSSDRSLEQILELKDTFPARIKVIKLSRNFGQLPAIMAGYYHSTGRYIINISADLQDPPELINEMIAYQINEEFDIVICTRNEREENIFRRLTSALFYLLIKRLSFQNMPLGGFDFVMISAKIKELIIESREANPFWQGQILWTGYKIKFIPYKRLKRPHGKSGWSISKKNKYLIDGVLSYSYLPIRLMSIIGALIAMIGFIYAIFIILAKIFGDVPFKGWAPLMVLVLVLSGVQMLMLGIIGEYLWRTLDQVRNRPYYLIEKIYE